MDNQIKNEFYLISENLGEIKLSAKDWGDVSEQVYNDWANCGKVKVIKRTWKLVAEEPYFIDTDYN